MLLDLITNFWDALLLFSVPLAIAFWWITSE